jgi:hypothetical protein
VVSFFDVTNRLKVNCGKNWVISRRMTGIRILVSVKFTKVGESI